jgi:Kef-type K+ transport system membrane component KefB
MPHAPRFSGSPLLPAVIVCLGSAAFAAQIGLAAIIGAFLAGMVVAETKEQHPIEQEVAPLHAFFPPFFFAFIGTEIGLSVFAGADTLGLVAALTALAAATKFAGAWLGARRLGSRNAAFAASAWCPAAKSASSSPASDAHSASSTTSSFGVVVAMSVATTLLVPPLLRALARRDTASTRSPPGRDRRDGQLIASRSWTCRLGHASCC